MDFNLLSASIGGIVGSVITALVNGFINLRKSSADITQQKRIDTINEWEQLYNKQQEEIDQLKGEISGTRDSVLKCREEHTKCQLENAQLRGRQDAMEVSIKHLQELIAKMQPPKGEL